VHLGGKRRNYLDDVHSWRLFSRCGGPLFPLGRPYKKAAWVRVNRREVLHRGGACEATHFSFLLLLGLPLSGLACYDMLSHEAMCNPERSAANRGMRP